MKKFIALAISVLLIVAGVVAIALIDKSEAPAIIPADKPTAEMLAETERLIAKADTADGTLNYEYDLANDKVTISYMLNGEKVSYTVPNKNNYTFGGFAATDDYGRSQNTSTTVGLYGDNGERYVGLFYFLWQGEHGDSGVFDLQKIIDNYGKKKAGSDQSLYAGVGAMHWFAEPLYGYYYANDEWVHRKHAELLANINVDFLYFDVTNGYYYLNNALQVMKELHELNEQGYDAPQVVFYCHTQSASVVRGVYDNIYSKGLYEDTWFKLNGKPVIVAEYSDNIKDFFTVKLAQWPNEPARSEGNSWPWMDFEWPQRTFTDEKGQPSAVSVSIAQHSGNCLFSSSALYDYNMNRGRAFNKAKANAKYVKQIMDAVEADPTLSYQGGNFQAQWDRAIEANVPFVLVTGWNEWVAQRQPAGGYTIQFVDTASVEYSRDAEMMRGGYFDSYYLQLASNIQRYKGAAPVVVQDARNPIDVTGDFAQWDKVKVSYTDFSGDTADRDGRAFGSQKMTNTSGRNDIVEAKVTNDTTYLYFYVKCADTITAPANDSSWMQIYVNTDGATTGWYGYDYIVNYKANADGKTTVAKFSGADGKTFGFTDAGEVSYKVDGNKLMVAVPMEMLGIASYNQIYVEFKVADSDTVYDEMEDFYIDGDAAPLGRLNYIYQNYIPNVSADAPIAVVKVAEKADQIYREEHPETEPETTVADETTVEDATTAADVAEDTTGDAEATTEEEKKDSGCGGSVAAVSVVALVFTLGAAVIRKKN